MLVSVRDCMVASAIALFRRKGVDSTSLVDVVEHAGAPRGSIYHHFPSGKAQLAEEATRTAGAAMSAFLARSLSERGPAETLSAVVRTFRAELVASDFASGCPVAAGALGPGACAGAKNVAGESFTVWESVIANALWELGMPMDGARSRASLAISAIEGALIVAKAQRSTDALDRIEAELVALVADS